MGITVLLILVVALVIGTSMAIFNPEHDIISQFFPITGSNNGEEYYGDPLNSIFFMFF